MSNTWKRRAQDARPRRRRRTDQPRSPVTRSRNDAAYWTLRRRLHRAWRAFHDYPGRRVRDGGALGTLVICGEPYGCGGSGVLHEADEPPPFVEPEESSR